MSGGVLGAPVIVGGCVMGVVATLAALLVIQLRAARIVVRAEIAAWSARIEEEWRES